MPLTEDEIYDNAIANELKGVENEAQRCLLNGNLGKWKDNLARKVAELDAQFTSRRAESFENGGRETRVQYEIWRRSAVEYKQVLIRKLRELKERVKEENQKKSDDSFGKAVSTKAAFNNSLLEELVLDIKEIKELLKEYL